MLKRLKDWWLRRIEDEPDVPIGAGYEFDPQNMTSSQERLVKRGLCPVDGGQLLAGPAAGVAMNVLCDRCHREYNVANFGSGLMIADYSGVITGSRLRVFGVES